MNADRSTIDWIETRKRLPLDAPHIRADESVSPERIERIMAHRAELLASRQSRSGAQTDRTPVIVFRVGDERCGIELSELAQIAPLAQCTPIPGAPPSIAGIINLKGKVICVLDVAAVLQARRAADATAGYVLFMKAFEGETGLRVDALEDISHIDFTQLNPSTQDCDCTRGITSDGVRIINAGRLLNHAPSNLEN